MTKRITTDQLEAIRKRAAAATEGPWTVAYTTDDNFILDSVDWNVLGNPNQDGNAEFIAKAREDIPALLAEVERLKERISATSRNRNGWMTGLFRWQERANRLFRDMQKISEERGFKDAESMRKFAKEAVERELSIGGDTE